MSISVISACKNRVDALSISASSWILFDEIDEIIIVDWNSDPPANHLTELSSKIKVVTVEKEKYFNQPQPLNLAASISTGDYILKLDSDTILNPYYNFFESHSIDETSFLTGFRDESKDKEHPCYSHFRGTLYLNKENFFKIGGYNENMGEYATWEDGEIVERLLLLGLKHKKINHNLSTAISIPHSDKERIENFKSYHEDKELEDKLRKKLNSKLGKETNDLLIYKALLETHRGINYSKYKPAGYYIEPVIKWNIEQVGSQNYIAQKYSINKII